MASIQSLPTKDWQSLQNVASNDCRDALVDCGCPEFLIPMLVDRGISSPEKLTEFLTIDRAKLHDPFKMCDMDKAVNRMVQALGNAEKVMVYGDYDVDGSTSVAMTYSFMKELGFNVLYYLPDRYEEGYGISYEGIEAASAHECSLIIALDCGTRDFGPIERAKELEIDVIVCDHHEPDENLPEAFAVLNPKRSDCNYPFDGLSGCGVGFKLLHGFSIQNDIDERILFSFLDLLALSICADIVPMMDENRVLCAMGLESINYNPRPAFRSMLKSAGSDSRKIQVGDLVFGIAPRINAAGRMKHAELAVEFLICTNPIDVEVLGKEIDELNLLRRQRDKSTTTEALQVIEDQGLSNHPATVVHQPHWNKGVIGIVASRLMDQYYRPTIVLTGDHQEITGSARSISGVNVHELLSNCSSELLRFGGHAMAAGLTMKAENLEKFRDLFNKEVASVLGDDELVPQILIDGVLDLDEFTIRDYLFLKKLEPFGPGNLNPILMCKSVELNNKSKIIGSDKSHLSLEVKSSRNKVIKCLAFGRAEDKALIDACDRIDVAFTIEENVWRGKSSLQFHIKDWRPAAEDV